MILMRKALVATLVVGILMSGYVVSVRAPPPPPDPPFEIPPGTWPFVYGGLFQVQGTITVSGTPAAGDWPWTNYISFDVTTPGSNPGGPPPSGSLDLAKYVTFQVTNYGDAAFVSCTFNVYYNDADLAAAGIPAGQESNLVMYRWTGSEWVALPSALGSDVNGKYVQGTTTTFSGFGPMTRGRTTVGGITLPVNSAFVVAPYFLLVGLVAIAVYGTKRMRKGHVGEAGRTDSPIPRASNY